MFQFESEPISIREPWMLSLEERLVLFRKKSFRVAYYSHRPNTSSFRYRAWNMANMLNKHSNEISAGWFFGVDGIALEDVIKDADVLVVHRSGYSSHLAELIRLAKKYRTRVLFDVDDFIFEPTEVPNLLNTLDIVNRAETHLEDQEWEKWLGTAKSMKMAAGMCDGITTTTEYLSEKAELHLDLPAEVMPNFLSDDQLEFSNQLYNLKSESNFKRDSFIDIGYFSGTPSHNRDFAIALGALDSLLSNCDEVRLTIVGFLDVPNFFTEKHIKQIRHLPLTNYMDLQRLISSVEINIAPLQQNEFTHGKSELKFFDAAAVGVPTIASPTKSMEAVIQNGKTSLISKNHEWYLKIDKLIDSYETHGAQMGKLAKKSVENFFTSQKQVSRAEKLLLAN